MKALTLTQPWATLVAIGVKRIETRSWFTRYRGPLAIHAAKGFPGVPRRICESTQFQRALGWPVIMDWKSKELKARIDALPVGAIIATASLLDCREVVENHTPWHAAMDKYMVAPPEPELNFGDYEPGRYGWMLGDIMAMEAPVPAKGALGLWEWAT